MARTSTITFDQVAAAANAIKAAGEKPTARRVREALGTGSMATVLRFFQQWQGSGSAASDDDQEEVTLDPAIIKAITTAIAAQVAAASVDAAQRIAELEGERAALMQEVERMAVDVEELEKDCGVCRESAARLEGERDALRAENQKQEKEIGLLVKERQAAFTAADVAGAKLEASEQVRKTLEQRLSAQSSELENSRISVQACQARLEAAAREIVERQEEAKVARLAAVEARNEAAELRGMLAALKGEKVKPVAAAASSSTGSSSAKKKAPVKAKADGKTSALPLEPANG